MKNRNSVTILALILAIIITFGYLAHQGYSPSSREVPVIPSHSDLNPLSTSTPRDAISEDAFTMNLYEKRKVKDAVINPWAVLEDSRCPATVQCIQAGRVRVAVNISSPYKKVNTEMEPGDRVFVGSFTLLLKEVNPPKITTRKIQDNEYRFVFEVLSVVAPVKPIPPPTPYETPTSTATTTATSTATTTPPVSGECFAGGCSGQICSDDPNAISTCEYKAAYACYRSAKCERQQNGQCGWTDTPELRSCLINPSERR